MIILFTFNHFLFIVTIALTGMGVDSNFLRTTTVMKTLDLVSYDGDSGRVLLTRKLIFCVFKIQIKIKRHYKAPLTSTLNECL